MTTVRWCVLAVGAGFTLLSGDHGFAETANDDDGPTWHFDSATVGELPRGWRTDGTAQEGPLATWAVTADPTAPSGDNVLALKASNHQSASTLNLCWSRAAGFFNGTATVRFRITGGTLDPGAGIAWRIQDRNDYYASFLRPADRSLRVWVVSDGRAKELASTTAAIEPDAWQALTVQQSGERVTCTLNGKQLLSVKDDTIVREGSVGFWTAADTTAAFDELSVEVETEKAPDKKRMPKEKTRQGTRYLEGS